MKITNKGGLCLANREPNTSTENGAADPNGSGLKESPPKAASIEGSPAHFLLTTLFLRRCIEYLTPDARECITYVSGMQRGPAIVLDELIPFQMQERGIAYVSGNIIASTAALIRLSDQGFQLWGTAHSHPGHGAIATTPSGIDYAHHRRLERGGYKALGIIVTRDGYVRFYSDKLAFRVEVIGKDGQWVDGNRIFKLALDFKGPSEPEEDKEQSEQKENQHNPNEHKKPRQTGTDSIPAHPHPPDAGGKRCAGDTD